MVIQWLMMTWNDWRASVCVWRWHGDGGRWLSKELNFHLWSPFKNPLQLEPHHGPITLRKVIHKIRCFTHHTSDFSCYFVKVRERSQFYNLHLRRIHERNRIHSHLPAMKKKKIWIKKKILIRSWRRLLRKSTGRAEGSSRMQSGSRRNRIRRRSKALL